MPERFTTLDDVRKTSDAELASLAYTMPREWAIHFEYRLQHILDRIKCNTSPIGRCTNYAVTIKEQHRGWLHAHCPLRMEKASDVLTAEGNSHCPDWLEEMVNITTSLPGGGMVAEQKAADRELSGVRHFGHDGEETHVYANQRHRCVEGHCDPKKCRYPHTNMR